ncbi:PhpK family radical SAM P-methyltransferase [Paractinoplanes rishiriensis]|uniref:PhpK family radical SAM P-methyltransferase n=1 Tax=Paractinoplanes rishiriensis TaxID=1050105 RepID=A0A919K2J4_9ACTN|nr:PhpK family radical SAM P-methyltransferase [Actinoplanes rishiriensis]GIE99510.1 hypothetical protein Ari01nite_69750 [Actinoplanes rishiriensis]
MVQGLDCLVLGYNDPPFSNHEQRVLNRGPDFPDRRIFMRDHLVVDGSRLPYMDVINHYVGERGIGPPDSYYHVGEVANLAAVYLTSFLVQRGCTATFASLFHAEKERIAALLRDQRPRVVAITTTFYLTAAPVAEIVAFVRSVRPESLVAVGGPLIDNLARDLDPETLTEMFEWMDADVYVHDSQGECALLDLVRGARAGESPAHVDNVYWRNGEEFRFTRRRPENTPVDEGTINWRLFDDTELGRTAQTRTARSCAFKCSFCDFPARAGALSLAGLDVVEAELTLLAERGVEHVVFIDDTFNVPLPRFKELCRMMIRNRFPFRWYSFFRASSARDEETYDLMAASGCAAVFLGIESADDGVLKLMHKSATSDAYRSSIRRLTERSITTFASFVVGFPGETAATVQRTIDFLNEAQPSFFRAEPWWYNHRSPIHAQADVLGITGQGYQWRHATMDIDGAGDALDRIFAEVTGSVWIPTYNFDFWALPYLFGKGFTQEQITAFLRAAQRSMRFNADPGTPAARAAAEEVARSFDGVVLRPPRYRMPRARPLRVTA